MLLDDISKNRALAKEVADSPLYKISVLSNIMVSQLKDPLEIIMREKKINAMVQFGDYDNIVQDSEKMGNSQAVVVVWEVSNLTDGFYYKCLNWNNEAIQLLVEKTKSEIDLMFKNLDRAPLVIFNKFTTILFTHNSVTTGVFEKICDELNAHVESVKPRNCYLINVENIISGIGVTQAFNKRLWHSSKMLYSYEFLSLYAQRVSAFFLSTCGKAKKAIVLDCDNTLWKGIIGEDGIEGIALNHQKKDGVFFEEVHHLIKSLTRKGIILALNSKNNEKDVQQVFLENPQLPIRWDDFLVKKINWQDKATNLKGIASELNIGIDSLIHMDDSDFEVNFIKQELPEVTVIQVPKYLPDYPSVLRNCMNLFFNLNATREDADRVEMYKTQQVREEIKGRYTDIEDYLVSLQLEMQIKLNSTSEIARIAQMTQKTNQFNLTTHRYTEAEIEQKMKDGKHYIFSFELKDKFGDYGTTGLCIVNRKSSNVADIDTLLMSCRIIGRNVEVAFFDFLIDFLSKNGVSNLTSKYIKTFKNEQVENLFNKFGMIEQKNDGITKIYQLALENYHAFNVEYIKVNYGKQD